MPIQLPLAPLVSTHAPQLLVNLASESLPVRRQLATLNVLASGERITRGRLMQEVEEAAGHGCYGHGAPKTRLNLLRNDLATLRRLGVPIRYSRRRSREGYYWPDAECAAVVRAAFEGINYESVPALAAATPRERFSAIAQLADLAAAAYAVQETQADPTATPTQLRMRIRKRIQRHARRERAILR